MQMPSFVSLIPYIECYVANNYTVAIRFKMSSRYPLSYDLSKYQRSFECDYKTTQMWHDEHPWKPVTSNDDVSIRTKYFRLICKAQYKQTNIANCEASNTNPCSYSSGGPFLVVRSPPIPEVWVRSPAATYLNRLNR